MRPVQFNYESKVIINPAMTIANSGLPFSVAVIGGGPSGLIAAEILSRARVQVDVYDAMPSVGRKFLMAGKGGMNITHSEAYDQFLSRYSSLTYLEPMLTKFGPDALRAWLHELGIETFIGSSGRVFPVDMKAAPLLRAWLHRLRSSGVRFHVRHQWLGWSDHRNMAMSFATPSGNQCVSADAVILALGGGSWARLGSTGAWVPLLVNRGIPVKPLRPSNCGFETRWSDYFFSRYEGRPIKAIEVSFTSFNGVEYRQQGECVVTQYGLEGGLIYTLSSGLRDQIDEIGSARIQIDLAPGKTLQMLISQLSKPRGKLSLANYLRKRTGMEGVKAGLLREILSVKDFDNPIRVAEVIKALPVVLTATRPLDEAISSAGGGAFEALDQGLMLRALPGVFCAGEMLDWEAPTGGYLLTACFASGYSAAVGVLAWLKAGQP